MLAVCIGDKLFEDGSVKGKPVQAAQGLPRVQAYRRVRPQAKPLSSGEGAEIGHEPDAAIAHRRQCAHNPDGKPEFFSELPVEGRFGCFAGFNLSSGKLPASVLTPTSQPEGVEQIVLGQQEGADNLERGSRRVFGKITDSFR